VAREPRHPAAIRPLPWLPSRTSPPRPRRGLPSPLLPSCL
jgi:hypothetical protein